MPTTPFRVQGMSAPRRLAAFGVIATLVFAGSAALGAAVGPEPTPPPARHEEHVEPVSNDVESSTTVVTSHGGHP